VFNCQTPGIDQNVERNRFVKQERQTPLQYSRLKRMMSWEFEKSEQDFGRRTTLVVLRDPHFAHAPQEYHKECQ